MSAQHNQPEIDRRIGLQVLENPVEVAIVGTRAL